MKEVTTVQNPDTTAATRLDPAQPGSRLRLPADERAQLQVDVFMDMPRAGRAERERRSAR